MKKIIIGILAFGFIGFLFWIQNRNEDKAKSKVEYLMNHGQITRGIVKGKSYNSINGSRYLSAILYSYQVGNKKYSENLSSHESKAKSKEAEKAWNYDIEILKEDSFVVLYDSEDPSTSLLCLDYPLTKKSDLDYYKETVLNIK